jgi:hypothetical protein
MLFKVFLPLAQLPQITRNKYWQPCLSSYLKAWNQEYSAPLGEGSSFSDIWELEELFSLYILLKDEFRRVKTLKPYQVLSFGKQFCFFESETLKKTIIGYKKSSYPAKP